MTAVAIQPTIFNIPEMANSPMILRLVPMNIVIAITGTDPTPLITALQKSALIGSNGETVMATPLNVAMTMVA